MGEEVAYRTEPVWNCLDSCRENLADTAEMGDIDESAEHVFPWSLRGRVFPSKIG
jgi:hypothetical protein